MNHRARFVGGSPLHCVAAFNRDITLFSDCFRRLPRRVQFGYLDAGEALFQHFPVDPKGAALMIL